jgi:hypothetical protein
MDERIDVPGADAPVQTVPIDRLVGPFRWIKRINEFATSTPSPCLVRLIVPCSFMWH